MSLDNPARTKKNSRLSAPFVVDSSEADFARIAKAGINFTNRGFEHYWLVKG